MQPFHTHRGLIALLEWNNINTDLIIPARYLKRIERTGFGPLLFADKRYAPGAAPPVDQPEQSGPLDPAFPLNSPALKNASILVAGSNFGCGSSREHAVWAIQQAGYRVVITPGIGEGFADIFESNAYNNGLLPIELPQEDWDIIATAARTYPGQVHAVVNLQQASITLEIAASTQSLAPIPFSIPDDQRNRLLKGLDAIAETLIHDEAIRRHEASMPPWLIPQA